MTVWRASLRNITAHHSEFLEFERDRECESQKQRDTIVIAAIATLLYRSRTINHSRSHECSKVYTKTVTEQ